jgi:vanadium chloroperoxidase
MIIENGFSRVYLGVHWSFDAFAVDNTGNPDFSEDKIGGAPLGVKIAEDIYSKIIKGGFNSGILKSTVPPRS